MNKIYFLPNSSCTDKRRQDPTTIKQLKATKKIMVLNIAANDYPPSLSMTTTASFY